jgi:RimJ/RimL family protein N-acetyltransferase
MTVDAIRFEPLSTRHLEAVVELVHDPEVRRFTRFPDPPDPGFPARWIARYDAGRADGTLEAVAAVDAHDLFLGVGLVPRIDHDAQEVELGYVVAPEARGRGVARALLTEMTRWSFDEGCALRAELVIDVANVPSQHVAAACGYQLEGVMRSLHVKNGLRADCQLWSRLADD